MKKYLFLLLFIIPVYFAFADGPGGPGGGSTGTGGPGGGTPVGGNVPFEGGLGFLLVFVSLYTGGKLIKAGLVKKKKNQLA